MADDMTVEVAVNPEGTVSINIKDFPMGDDGWGHLSFNVAQVQDFIRALQHAAVEAHKRAQAHARMAQLAARPGTES